MSFDPVLRVESVLRKPAAVVAAGSRPVKVRRLPRISQAVRWMIKETPLLEVSLTCAVFVGLGTLVASQPGTWPQPVLASSAAGTAPLQKWIDALASRLGLPPRPEEQQKAVVPVEVSARPPLRTF